MKVPTLFLVLCVCTQERRNFVFLKRTIDFQRSRGSVTLLEVTDVGTLKTLEQTRLEDDENLLEEQELIENMSYPPLAPEMPYTPDPIPQPRLFETIIAVMTTYVRVRQETITLVCSGFFIFLCGIAMIWLMVNSNAHEIKPRKKRKLNEQYHPVPQYDAQDPILTQSILQESQHAQLNRYSIMDSNTESSTFSQRVFERSDHKITKYRITEYAPEIRDPFQESFVKQSLRAQNRTNYSTDLSLLEIDELLKEMLPDDQLRQVEQYF